MAWDSDKFKDHQTKSHKAQREAKARGVKQAEERRNPKRGEDTGAKKKS